MEINPYASPQTSSEVPTRSATSLGVWRRGDLLIVAHKTALPDRCVKCNAPVDQERMRFRLSWYPPIALAGLLLGVLPFLLIVLVTRKKMTVHVGVCDQHRARRRLGLWVGYLGALAGIGLMIVSATSGTVNGWLFLGGITVLAATVIYVIRTTPIIRPKRIDKQLAWLRGACPEYLAALPLEG
jgi:hypothetical protein